MKSALKRAWDLSGWMIGGYTIWKQLQSLSSAKDEFYQELSPELQSKYDSVFGHPMLTTAVPVTQMPAVKVVTPAKQISQVTQIKTGS